MSKARIPIHPSVRFGLGGVIVAALLAFAIPASAATATGYDISYPQCNAAFPPGGSFRIVGVNGGRVYSPNPCLGTGNGPSELAWAGRSALLYANTADPGPALSSHWPNGQTSPRECNTASSPGSDTAACNYDYGWNAAADSYADAVNASIALGWVPAGSTRTAQANEWWLDVESANSWRTDTSLNVQALQGGADYLASVGATSVGFYANAGDWQSITGGTLAFSAHSTWLAGPSSLTDAQSRCGSPGFTGGTLELVQYPSNGFDGDVNCTPLPALQFATGSQTLAAGTASSAMAVGVAQPVSSATSVTLSSSAPTGRFASSASGPWSATLPVAIPAGATRSSSFYYTDTTAGSPTIGASATGFSSASQTETVTAGPLATISISPAGARVRVGTSQTFTASGSDAYGNPVLVSPSWTVTPALGSFSPSTGRSVTFSATSTGSGTIAATSGAVRGSTPVTVTSKKGR
jgi:hypothetical protein